MNLDRLRQIEDLFAAASALPPHKRQAFLSEKCEGDAQLIAEVNSLLLASSTDDSFMRTSVAEVVGQIEDNAERLPQQLGPYKPLRRIGKGGMGTVYLGERADSEYTKQVAIKVIRQGADSEEIVTRFLQERQVLAQLEHPNIARLIDGGMSKENSPYLVMEYVDGVSIDRYCNDNSLSIRERLELFRKVCAAVHYAHQSLVIHRDLKPQNILVTTDGDPKLLDFGIAKVLDDSTKGDVTVTQERRLTPQYASPEQARGEPMTTSSDVYSLGVILYQILTGERPYDFSKSAPLDYARIICETKPERPSTIVVQSDASALGLDTAHVRKRLSGDLDNIVLMALRKEADRRYASAMDLSEDIRRYLAGLTVSARDDTIRYRTAKFVRRNPVPVALSLVTLVVIVAALFVSLELLFEARAATEREHRRAAEARQQSYIGSIVAAREALPNDEILSVRSVLERAPEEHRAWEWNYLDSRCDDALISLPGHKDRVMGLCASYDGQRVASTSTDNSIRVWHAATGEQIHVFEQDYWPRAVVFHPDDDKLLVQDAKGPIRIVDLTDGRTIRSTEGQSGSTEALILTPDKRTVISAGFDRKIHGWDVDTLEPLFTLEGHRGEIAALAVHPDGKWLLSGAREPGVRVWDLQTHESLGVLSAHEHSVEAIAFDADGDRFATAGFDNKILIWDTDKAEVVRTIRRDHLVVRFLYLDDDHVISGGGRTVSYWSTVTGQPFGIARGHTKSLNVAVMSAHHGCVITGGMDGIVRIFDRYSPAEQFSPRPEQQHVHPAQQPLIPVFDQWGEHLFVGSADGKIQVYECSSRSLLRELPAHPAKVIAMRRVGGRLWSLGSSGTIACHDMRTGALLEENTIELSGRPKAGFSVQGDLLAVSSPDGFLVVRPTTGEIVAEARTALAKAFAFDDSGERLAVASDTGTLTIWNPLSGSKVRDLGTASSMILALAFSPDGSRIITGSVQGELLEWELEEEPKLLGKTAGMVFALCYTPDGRRVVCGNDSMNIHVWDPLNATELLRLSKVGGWVRGVAADPTGRWIAAVGGHALQLHSAEKHGDNLKRARARQKSRPAARALLATLSEQLPNVSAIADHVERSTEISDDVRQECLNLLLRGTVAAATTEVTE